MWWHHQFQAWLEILFGVSMLITGLLLEFGIDVWRDRYLKRQAFKKLEFGIDVDKRTRSGTFMTQTSGTFPELTKRVPKGKGKKR